jgi:PAS domain S-box-containing protein
MKESESTSDAAPTGGNRSVDGTQTDYRRIVDSVPGCILVADAEGQIVYANKVAVATLGRSLEDLLGAGWQKSLDCSLINDAKTTWQRCVQKREPLNAIWRFRQHDDTYRWQHLKAEPTTDSDSTEVTWYILGVDVDEQFKSQEALKASEQEAIYRWYGLNSDIDDLYRSRELLRERELQLNLLTETLPALLWKAEPDGTIVYMNKTATEYCGRTLEQVQQVGWSDLVHPDDLDEVVAHSKRLFEGGVGADIALRFLGTDGRYRWFHTIAASVRDDSGKIIAAHSVMLDTTAQKNAELACSNLSSRCRE